MANLAQNHAVLRKRLVRLIRDNRRIDRPELTEIILPQLQHIGKVVLIGGVVRDVARKGGSRFKSDLDCVLYDCRRDAFLKLMNELGGRPNRYGGFALSFTRWKVDVWALEDTWARTAGLVKVEEPADLLNCTFFDWDAVMFDLQNETVIAKPSYFDLLARAVLDVNLEENPNPRGSLVRALRRGALWRVRYGLKLTAFVRRQLDMEKWEELVALDDSAFSLPVLRHCDPAQLRDTLRNEMPYRGQIVTEPFGSPSQQLELTY